MLGRPHLPRRRPSSLSPALKLCRTRFVPTAWVRADRNPIRSWNPARNIEWSDRRLGTKLSGFGRYNLANQLKHRESHETRSDQFLAKI
jgi:hypothetical protein